jgi:hypothetical protein
MEDCKEGDVVMSPDAWKMVAGRVRSRYLNMVPRTRNNADVTQYLLPSSSSGGGSGNHNYLATQVLLPLETAHTDELIITPEIEPAIRSHIRKCVLAKIDGGEIVFHPEIRKLTVIFVQIPQLTLKLEPTNPIRVSNEI